jgi:hypothetical protein
MSRSESALTDKVLWLAPRPDWRWSRPPGGTLGRLTSSLPSRRSEKQGSQKQRRHDAFSCIITSCRSLPLLGAEAVGQFLSITIIAYAECIITAAPRGLRDGFGWHAQGLLHAELLAFQAWAVTT